MRQSLDIVQSINTDNNMDVLVSFFQLLDPFLYFRLAQSLVELLRIDSDNESARLDQAILVLNLIRYPGLSTPAKLGQSGRVMIQGTLTTDSHKSR